MKKITLEEAKISMKKLNINPKIIKPSYFKKAMQVELEHGLVNKKTNVTQNNLNKTAKIALAHLMEFPDYYIRLEKMEKQSNKYWTNKKKPNLFN